MFKTVCVCELRYARSFVWMLCWNIPPFGRDSRDGLVVVGAVSPGDLAKGPRFKPRTGRDPDRGSRVQFELGGLAP